MSGEVSLQVGVKIVLKNKEGKYLLLRRSLVKYPEVKGRWDIVGGRINLGEPLLENIKREIREETALQLIGTPKLIAAQDILRTPGRHVVRLTYSGLTDGEVVLDINENDMYSWYTLDELSCLDDVDMYFKELLDKGILSDRG